jgi:hypothetical protein
MTSTDIVVRRDGMAAKVQYAKELANSGLLPAAYRRNPANVLYAVEYGEMLGLTPMAAINGIHVIDGKPTASASLISALVRRAGHRLRVSSDGTKALAEIVRSDDPDYTFRSEWTMDRAKQAGLTGKDVWKKYPAAMLKARAITEVARDACEEALSGVHYTPEELGAAVDEDGVPVQVQAERVDPVQDETDWDAEMVDAAGDVKALGDLYKKAVGIYGDRNPKLVDRIIAAGHEAAKKAESSASDEVLDAELVDEPAVEDVATVVENPRTVADAGADRARTQIAGYAKATQMDPNVVDALFADRFGHPKAHGTEAELLTFLADLKKNGLPTATPVSPVRAVA